jgi:ribonuclease VapC
VIVDTSAIVAILRREPEANAFVQSILESDPRRLSAANYLEAAIIVDRSTDPVARGSLDGLLERLHIVVEPVTPSQARIARQAYRDFGKGAAHPAGLNYGDCFAYALAREMGEPLLFKGEDFARTDIRLVGSRAERHRISELLAAQP